MLKMKKMNELKIFALVILSLSKFETMFGMKKFDNEDNIAEEEEEEDLNKNFYLIDDLGNKITLDDDRDIKFKINKEVIEFNPENIYKYILTIKENKEEKILACTKGPFLYMNETILVTEKDNNYAFRYIPGVNWGKEILHCTVVNKIGEDSMKDDYILVNAENNKIYKIEDKNIVFKLLTRKKYLELKEKLNNPNNFLKNDEKYILNESQKPLFFEEEENNKLILYVRRLDDNLCLAGLDLVELKNTINKDNSIEVRMAKKEGIPMVEEEVEKIKEEEINKVEKKVKDDSSECCCGIC